MSIESNDTLYTGRKIRREFDLKNVSQETSEIRTTSRPSLTFFNWSKDDITLRNLTSEETVEDYQKLISFFESSFMKNLSSFDFNSKYMIGVFGTYSQTFIRNAIDQAKRNIRTFNRNVPLVFFLSSTNYCRYGDIYSCCAESLHTFICNYLKAPFLYEPYNQLFSSLSLIKDVPANSEEEQEYHFSVCKRVMQAFSEISRYRKVKIVWNVEIQLGELNEEFLDKLSMLAADNFIVAVNCPSKLRIEKDFTGAKRFIGLELKNDGTYAFSNLHFVNKYEGRIWSSD